MKVGTDGVLLGAWTDVSNAGRVLDVGTGTGLVTLMIAQRNSEAIIDTIEIDQDAHDQANGNIANSPWAERIHTIHEDFLTWSESENLKYDLIVCNPPYFKETVAAPDHSRGLARQENALPIEHLFRNVARMLTEIGSFSVILPNDRLPAAARIAVECDLHLNRMLRIKGTRVSPPKRVILELGKKFQPVNPQELTIGNGLTYTPEFLAMTREFYL